MPILEASNVIRLYKQYDVTITAVDRVNLSVEDGEFVAIMGSSGSGKSTLLHVCAGLDRANSGTVKIRGNDIMKMKKDELSRFRGRYTGFIFQKHNLIPQFTALENIMIPAVMCDRKDFTYEEHLKKLIAASKKLGVNMVTTFIGRDQTKTVEENLELFEQVWKPLIALAEENQVKIGIENCPMLFDAGQWPGGQNLATTPKIWREMFSRIPSEYFGLNYDPSHFVWQRVDYLKPLYEFKDKIFHVHYKDIKLYPDRLDDVGIMGYPLEYMAPKLPGLGDVDWGAYVSALRDIGYDGYTCVEVEDRAFEGSLENVKKSLLLSKRYIEQFVI